MIRFATTLRRMYTPRVRHRSVEAKVWRADPSMNNSRLLALSIAVLAVSTCSAQQSGTPRPASPAAPLAITLPGFADGTRIPDKYTCLAGPAVVSPEIQWSNVPAGTLSFVFFPSSTISSRVPRRGSWITRIGAVEYSQTPLDLRSIPAGSALPNGTHQMKRPRANAPSPYSYYGPCAPPGPNHHYVLELCTRHHAEPARRRYAG